jgi:hypothetical protein
MLQKPCAGSSKKSGTARLKPEYEIDVIRCVLSIAGKFFCATFALPKSGRAFFCPCSLKERPV